MQTENKRHQSAILLIHCPDRKGLIVSITGFILNNNGNILYLDQHVDLEKKMFFMRIEWDVEGFRIPLEQIGGNFGALAEGISGMKWKLNFSDEIPRMAIYVSRSSHCLYDVLSRCQSGEWKIKIPLIISNHHDLEPVAKKFGIEYHTFPVNRQNKADQESKQFSLLKEHGIDFIVLARYMQILSNRFVSNFTNRIINIHHAFLPAFPGAKPYHSAYARGVKIIGATSHYVTAELDAGPIIEQDVARVSHNDSVDDLVRKGRDLEKVVLSRAIWLHSQRKILVHENRTVIFN